MIKTYIQCSEFRAHSVFQGKRKLLKNPECKSILNAVKSFRSTLFFRASARCSKILNDKKHIFNAVNSGYILFFRASARCSKILNVKVYSMQ